MKYVEKLLNKIPIILVIVIYLLNISAAKSQTSLTKALDYDGDGKVDCVVFRSDNNYWYINKSTGGVISQQIGNFTLDTPAPGDYDGDGKGDIAVWRESNGNFLYLRSSNNTFFNTQFGIAGDEPVARDYDDDGKTDLAVVRRTNGLLNWYILKSSNNSVTGVQFGQDTDHPVPGDYDGDGKFDYAVQRPGPSETSQAFFFIYIGLSLVK